MGAVVAGLEFRVGCPRRLRFASSSIYDDVSGAASGDTGSMLPRTSRKRKKGLCLCMASTPLDMCHRLFQIQSGRGGEEHGEIENEKIMRGEGI